jgi:O-methyltransferase
LILERISLQDRQHASPSGTQLYLDLLKRTLSFALWPEPPRRVADVNGSRPLPTRLAISLVNHVLALPGLMLAKQPRVTASEREDGRAWSPYADTLIGLKRLDNLQECVETVLRDRVPGDLIETGVWRGGACIFMRAVLAAYGVTDRQVFAADSFEGLPKPDAAKYPVDAGDTHYKAGYLAASLEDVQENFRKYGLLDDKVTFLKGWFEDTLPAAPIQRLAILRLDGDMYGSTMDALRTLYPRLSRGGFCIIDDYALHGCKRAVDDYRTEHGITAELKTIDWTGRYWRKTESPE